MNELVELSLEEEIKSYLLYVALSDEAEYCFDLHYRNDLTFDERVKSFKRVVDQFTNESVDEIFRSYGVESFGAIGAKYYERWKDYNNKLHKQKGEDNMKTLTTFDKDLVAVAIGEENGKYYVQTTDRKTHTYLSEGIQDNLTSREHALAIAKLYIDKYDLQLEDWTFSDDVKGGFEYWTVTWITKTDSMVMIEPSSKEEVLQTLNQLREEGQDMTHVNIFPPNSNISFREIMAYEEF